MNPRRLPIFLENFARLWFLLRILRLNWDFPWSVIWDISISTKWQTKQKKTEYGRVLFTRAFQEHLVNRTWVWHLTVRSTTNQNTVYLVHPSSDWTIGNSIRTVPVVFNLIKVQWVSNEKLWKISPLVEQNKSLTTLHIYNFFPGHYGYLHTFINKSLPTGANKN